MSLRKLTRFVAKGEIKDGVLVYANERYVRTIIQGYEDTAKVRVVIERERLNRTKKQNNYYWFGLGLIAEHCGYTTDELHEVFKARYLKTKRVWRGADITVLRSTTELTSDEFGEYIDRIIQEGAELGVVIPMADKNYDLLETSYQHPTK